MAASSLNGKLFWNSARVSKFTCVTSSASRFALQQRVKIVADFAAILAARDVTQPGQLGGEVRVRAERFCRTTCMRMWQLLV